MHVAVQALDMMMVRLLRLADVLLVADDRYAVLAQRAIHMTGPLQGFLGPFQKGFNQ